MTSSVANRRGRPRAAQVGPGALTARSARNIRWVSVGTALVIAVCAVVLSYAGLHLLALRSGVPTHLAILLPVIIDGLQITGSLGVLYSTLAGTRTWYPWLLVLLGVGVSVWGNWVAAPDDLVSKGVHAASPLILAVVLEELLRVTRHRVRMHHQGVTLAAAARKTAATQAPAPIVTTTPAPVHPIEDQSPVRPSVPAVAPPALEPARQSGTDTTGSTARERIYALLAVEPDLSAPEVYGRLGTDPSSTRKIMKKRAEDAAKSNPTSPDASSPVA